MIDEIKNDIDAEIKMVGEIAGLINKIPYSSPQEQQLIYGVINSLKNRVKILNSSVTGLVKAISLIQRLPGQKTGDVPTGVDRITFHKNNEFIALNSKDKDRFLSELSISEGLLRKLRKRSLTPPSEKIVKYQKPNFYAAFANKFFLKTSSDLLKRGYFNSLNMNLRKANINFLTSTYLSISLLTSVIGIFIGLFLAVFFTIFTLALEVPFITLYGGSILMRILAVIWLIPAVPLAIFGAFYYYPSAEKSSLAGKIDSELPFVVLHMGSISGSGVEPTQIFKIVGLSKEYPNTRNEIRKLLNQLNVYGYDLVTALKNVALVTPSVKLSELLSGLATTISSGGDLKTFFEKRGDTLLLNYRLEREKFTRVAETFMDIYISVVIATPMILLLLLVLISVSGVDIGLSVSQLTVVILFTVALINVLFLWMLGLKQPTY